MDVVVTVSAYPPGGVHMEPIWSHHVVSHRCGKMGTPWSAWQRVAGCMGANALGKTSWRQDEMRGLDHSRHGTPGSSTWECLWRVQTWKIWNNEHLVWLNINPEHHYIELMLALCFCRLVFSFSFLKSACCGLKDAWRDIGKHRQGSSCQVCVCVCVCVYVCQCWDQMLSGGFRWPLKAEGLRVFQQPTSRKHKSLLLCSEEKKREQVREKEKERAKER